jgi:hypothetical protein
VILFFPEISDGITYQNQFTYVLFYTYPLRYLSAGIRSCPYNFIICFIELLLSSSGITCLCGNIREYRQYNCNASVE